MKLKPTPNQIKKFGKELTIKVIEKTQGKCWFCGVELLPTKGKATVEYQKKMLSFDHLVPEVKGGRNNYQNLVPSCTYCNNLKAEGGVDFLRARLLFEKNNWPTFSLTLFNFLSNKGIELHNITMYDANSEIFERLDFYFEKEDL